MVIGGVKVAKIGWILLPH